MSPQEVNNILKLLQVREQVKGNERNAKALYLAQCAVDGFCAISNLILSDSDCKDCEGWDECDN